MSIEGELDVTLHWDGARTRRVTVRSTRPVAAARVALGRPARDAAELLPTLYALCGHAQRAAATAALAAAGADLGPPAATAVQLEAVQEDFWRLLIDVPAALGLATATSAVAKARAAVARAVAAVRAQPEVTRTAAAGTANVLDALAREHIYASAPADWLAETDPIAFDRWCDAGMTLPARALSTLARVAPGLGHSDTPAMPEVEAAGWTSVVRGLRVDPAFAGMPTWGGVAVETGPLARQRDQLLVAALIARDGRCAGTRIAARLVELARLLALLRGGDESAFDAVRAWPLDAHTGLAAVQTARGLLLHLARVEDARVTDYRIVAPTEWNFHPDGALVHGLVGLAADDAGTLAHRAGLAVLALDPCIVFHVEVVGHA